MSTAVAVDPLSFCVFRLGDAVLAIDALLVSEVATLATATVIPGCAPAVRGVANLRGRALAVVDLGLVLGAASIASASDEALALVLRLPGRECGALVTSVDGVFAADPAGRRSANRSAEPAWIAGFQAFTLTVTAAQAAIPLVAAIIDPTELGARLDRLRPTRPAMSRKESA